MTGWEWLGIGGLSQGYVAAGLIPAAVASDTGGSSRAGAAPAPGHYRPGSHRRRRAPGQSRGLTALHGVRPDFGYLRIRSLVLPSNGHAIQRDPNEVIIGM